MPEHRQHGRPDVVRRGEELRDLAGGLVVGRDEDHRHLRELRVELRGHLAGVAALAEQIAVVRQQHDHGVLVEAELVEAVHEVPEPAVGHGDLAGVDRVQAAEQLRREVASEAVVRDPDLLARCSRGPSTGRCTRAAGSRARAGRSSRPPSRTAGAAGPARATPGRVLVDARRAGLLLVLAAPGVGEVLAHARHVAVVAHERRHPLLDELDRDRLGVAVVARLADDRAPVVPGLAERLVGLREGEVRVVRHLDGPVALVLQHLVPGVLVALDREPAGARAELRVGYEVPVREDPPAREDRAARRDRDHRLREGAVEAQAA